jgi:hypothetical protein
MRDQKITTQVLDAERLVALSGGIVPPPTVRLDESLPISSDERFAWERRLNRYLNSCGCAEGTAGLFVGVAIALIAYFAQSEPWPAWEIAAAVTLPLALLVGGKLVGHQLDRLRFRKICKRLLSHLAVDIVQEDHHG